MEDLSKCDGKKFRCIWHGMPVEGKIRVEFLKNSTKYMVYLCQNKHMGSECLDKFEYKYSWALGDGRKEERIRVDIQDFILIDTDLRKKLSELCRNKNLSEKQILYIKNAFGVGYQYMESLKNNK